MKMFRSELASAEQQTGTGSLPLTGLERGRRGVGPVLLPGEFDHLAGRHDLSLSDWGPYAPEWMGLSHIADRQRGDRVDFFMVPGLCRRETFPPDTLHECGLHLWDAAADLGYYAYRQQLDRRQMDLLYADVSYSRLADNLWLARCEFCNRSSEAWEFALEIYGGWTSADRSRVRTIAPEGSVWVNAIDHQWLQFARSRPSDHLTWHGWRRGQRRCPGTVSGFAIGKPDGPSETAGDWPGFGADAGDTVSYMVPRATGTGAIVLRAMLPAGAELELCCTSGGRTVNRVLEGTGDFRLYKIFEGELSAGELAIRSSGGAGVTLDGFFITSLQDADQCRCVPEDNGVEPALSQRRSGGQEGLSLDFGNPGGETYDIRWWGGEGYPRRFFSDDIMRSLSHGYASRNPYYDTLRHDGGTRKFAGVYLMPLLASPGESRIVHALLGVGGQENASFRREEELEELYRRQKQTAIRIRTTPGGEDYAFGQRLLAATLFTHVTFPVRVKGSNVRHLTSARYYNSVYSWDAGLTGLALAEFDTGRAVEHLKAYLTEPGDDESAFVFVGTPLPTQALLFQELDSRLQSTVFLEFFYPRLKNYYDFLSGNDPRSQTRLRGSNLLVTWDYFYNSGGWDDYPPQWEIRQRRLRGIAPAVITSYVIRFAKIMRAAARRLGRVAEAAGYEDDIVTFSRALQGCAWDPAAGVFSHVTHDAEGKATGFFRHEPSGWNYNIGMDGAAPLVAGICTHEQEDALFDLLEKLRGPYGLGVVRPDAPYYQEGGYWNGSVWMAHQWLFWKAALDHGRADFARRIALTALDLWKKETGTSYNCYEHFSATTGHGGGNHSFAGISSMVLKWFHAYFLPGTLTGGFNLWVRGESGEGGEHRFQLELDDLSRPGSTVLYVAPRPVASIFWNATPLDWRPSIDQALEIDLPYSGPGELVVRFRGDKA